MFPDQRSQDRSFKKYIGFFIYLTVLGLSYETWDLRCITRNLSLWHMDSLVVVCRLSSYGMQTWLLCSLWDLSSQTWDQTCAPCITRWILNHWATREVPGWVLMRQLASGQNSPLSSHLSQREFWFSFLPEITAIKACMQTSAKPFCMFSVFIHNHCPPTLSTSCGIHASRRPALLGRHMFGICPFYIRVNGHICY